MSVMPLQLRVVADPRCRQLGRINQQVLAIRGPSQGNAPPLKIIQGFLKFG
jgi:hypothetical protein